MATFLLAMVLLFSAFGLACFRAWREFPVETSRPFHGACALVFVSLALWAGVLLFQTVKGT